MLKNNKKSIVSAIKILIFISLFALAFTYADAAGISFETLTPVNLDDLNDNSTSNNNSLNYSSSSPVISSITPDMIERNAGVPTVAITGRNFNSSSIARWNGSERVTTFIDSRHLTMQLYAADINIARTNTI